MFGTAYRCQCLPYGGQLYMTDTRQTAPLKPNDGAYFTRADLTPVKRLQPFVFYIVRHPIRRVSRPSGRHVIFSDGMAARVRTIVRSRDQIQQETRSSAMQPGGWEPTEQAHVMQPQSHFSSRRPRRRTTSGWWTRRQLPTGVYHLLSRATYR
ncbi:hypothetical protein LY76DRAFT_289366 [Colletotrichum caudatum]|nr:hypothetical protein LY76DRAFT_289366 [Colletotrichum caudatum]